MKLHELIFGGVLTAWVAMTFLVALLSVLAGAETWVCTFALLPVGLVVAWVAAQTVRILDESMK